MRARAFGGTFILRVEDLDGPRTRPEAVTGNLEELRWLGLDWDEGPDVGGPHEPYLQSRRSAYYAAALERLREAGLVFECYLSRKDLATAASAPHAEAGGGERVYGEVERRLSGELAPARAAAGVTPSWRFRVPGTPVAFSDACAGLTEVDLTRSFGDFVVRRSDGLWAYQLAVTVDDHAMGVTEVVRARDLLPSAAAQTALHLALGHEPPRYCHTPLLTDGSGRRLAKRHGDLTLHALAGHGVAPRRVVGLLGHLLGMLSVPTPVSTAELLAAFDPGRHSCASAPLLPEHLDWLLA